MCSTGYLTRIQCSISKSTSSTPVAKESQLAKALRELGRSERSLFMIEWYSSSTLCRRCQAGLNNGEAAHNLKRAVFFYELGGTPRPVVRKQGIPCIGPQSCRQRERALEYRSRTCGHRAQTSGKEHPRFAVEAYLAAELGAHPGSYTWDSEQHLPEDYRSLGLPARLRRAA